MSRSFGPFQLVQFVIELILLLVHFHCQLKLSDGIFDHKNDFEIFCGLFKSVFSLQNGVFTRIQLGKFLFNKLNGFWDVGFSFENGFPSQKISYTKRNLFFVLDHRSLHFYKNITPTLIENLNFVKLLVLSELFDNFFLFLFNPLLKIFILFI